ncbi:hypothetical protein [Kitasatospora sp. NPDC094011]|uniref:hypothetical protein n=1 Tax=Kitasatospora sp. NPDC094011 TaxID=3364090 RepID=UPI003824FF0E
MTEAWRDAGTGQVLTSESVTYAAENTAPHGVPRNNNVTSPSAPRVSYGPNGVDVTIRGGNFYDIQGNYHRANAIYVYYGYPG